MTISRRSFLAAHVAAADALAAAFFSQGLVATFSGKGLLVNPPTGSAFLLSVACGAIAWLLFANATGLPVSTTHVSSGAIIGIGAESKESGLQWKTVREMLLAWVVTLPAAALVAALAFRLLA
jgi:PiT family inorganic phosphate transporter